MIMNLSLEAILSDPAKLDELDLPVLDQWIREYPYASWLHIIRALKKKRDGSLTDGDIHRAAMYAPNRQQLYDWLELDVPVGGELGAGSGELGAGSEERGAGGEERGAGGEELEEGGELLGVTDEGGDLDEGSDLDEGTEGIEGTEELVEEGELLGLKDDLDDLDDRNEGIEGTEELEAESEVLEEPEKPAMPKLEGKVLRSLLKNGRVEEREEPEVSWDPDEFDEEDMEEEEDEFMDTVKADSEGESETDVQKLTLAEEPVFPEEEEEEEEMTDQHRLNDEDDPEQDAWSFIAWLASQKKPGSSGESDPGEAGQPEKTSSPASMEKSGSENVKKAVETTAAENSSQNVPENLWEDEEEESDKTEHGKKATSRKKGKSSKQEKGKKKPLKKLIEKSIIQDQDIASEPLADLLAKQGHIQQATDMYERLRLIFPEKSAFFAQKIKKLKK